MQIEAGRKAAEADAALDETRKQKALAMYDQAAQSLQQTEDTRVQLVKLEAMVRQAPKRIEEIRSGKIQSSNKQSELNSVLVSGNLDAVELALSREQLAMQQAREVQRKYEDELARLLIGSKGLSEEIAARMKTLDQIDSDLLASASDEPPTLIQARSMTLQSRRMLRQAELEQLKLRLGSHDLLTNLAQAERDLALAEIVDRQKRLDSLTLAAQRLREAQARQARLEADELKSKSEALPTPLQVIAQENARYRKELEELINREQSIIGDLEAARLGVDEIKSDFERTRQRVEVVGMSKAIGKMLKRRRLELPSLQSYRRNTAQRAVEIDRATDRQIDIEELLRQRGDVHAVVASTLELLPEADRSDFTQQIEELAKVRRSALNELQKVYGRYIGQITSLDLVKRQLVEVASAYIKFIDDKLVWIPGSSVVDLLAPAEFFQAPLWLLAPGNWGLVAADASLLLQQRGLWVGIVLTLGLLLLMRKNRGKSIEYLTLISQNIGKIRTDSFKFTLFALAHTLIIIGPLPLLLMTAGWLLGSVPTAAPFTLSLSDALVKSGAILLGMSFLLQVCRADGLGDRHFGWPQAVRESLVRELSWMLPIAVSMGFLVVFTAGNELPPRVQFIGRIALFALMTASSLFVYRLLRRRSALIQALDAGYRRGPLSQLYLIWFPLLLLLPLAFAITSAWGYHNIAVHLSQRVEQTFWLFVMLFMLKEFILRSLFIAERRLRLEEALRRRDELRAQRSKDQAAAEQDLPPVTPVIPVMNIDELSEQNRRLVRAGFLFGAVIGVWSIWSELLPALAFFNNTELPFHASRIVDGIAKEVPVTLRDLMVGLIMVVITVLAAKNIPGVLEIALLQRLPLDPGARYAITSLTQYTIVGIGVLLAFSTLGLQWSNVQWLVAALSVGLGFGLQEIVANFISGIILLFERPIRVGDVVTIDDTTGKVSRIQIRATTIVNWNKQELLIPNKSFITGRVINWTLSDEVNRIVVAVGVAYGSDVDKAMNLMLEAAYENQEVLENPEPVASFEAFGDNALTLQLRSYLNSMENRLATITALHRAINNKFNAAGICIAFPQRDLHLDTSSPLDIRIHRTAASGSS
ncbi:MAG: mechanosensitive ion channel [Gammaproteobacteria bacterium]|nr:mechanosensitive ion channel [Gammaproteobacteria bacterium]